MIFKELFSSSSPSKIYGDALEKCRSHPEVGFSTLVISLCFSVVTVSLLVKSLPKESYKQTYRKTHVVLSRQTPADLPVLLAGQRRVGSKLESVLGQANASTEPE